MSYLWAGALVLALAALGFGLGARRSLFLTFTAMVGACAACVVLAARVGRTLFEQAGAVLLAFACAAWGARWAVRGFVRWAGRRGVGNVRMRGDRWLGAGLGVGQAAVVVWFIGATMPAGEGPGARTQAAAAAAAPRTAAAGASAASGAGSGANWLDGPIATVRAVRTLADLTPAEAKLVYEIPEVRAVAESEPMRPLWEDLSLVEQAGQAARGSRLALFAVGSDPRVKLALEDPDFLSRVRRVDLVLLADRVATWRADGHATGAAAEK